jgi:ABC-type bacteriocin/lantibiotic exporter with double-glycine peptidase domain
MAEQGSNSTFSKLVNILKYEKAEISSVYFYAILGGLIQLSLPLGIQAIIAFVMGGGISTSIVLLIIAVVLGVFLVGFLRVNQMRIIETIQQQIFVRYTFWYASRIPKLNLSKVDDYYLPEFVNRFFDVQNLQKGMSKLLLDMPAATIQILFGLMLLSFYSATFIIFGLSLVIVLYLLLRLTGNKGLQSSMKESDFKYKAGGYLQDLARAVTAFKFSSAASLHIKKTDQFVGGYLDARTEHFKVLKFQYWTLIGFKVMITAAMLSVGALLVIQQELNLGQFVAAEIVIVMIIDSVEKIIINLESVYDVLTSVDKLSKILDKPEESQGTEPLECHQKGLELKLSNVDFGYQLDKWVLHDINLDIHSGEQI